VAEVAELLRQSTMQLCRNLKENPNVAENIAKVARERQSLQQLLAQCLNELTVYGTFSTLTEMVTMEETREVEVAETIEREKQTTAAVRSLKQTIRDEKVRQGVIHVHLSYKMNRL
jgi:IQ domain-containing protein G